MLRGQRYQLHAMNDEQRVRFDKERASMLLHNARENRIEFAFAIGATSGWAIPGAPFLLAATLLGLAITVAVRATKAG